MRQKLGELDELIQLLGHEFMDFLLWEQSLQFQRLPLLKVAYLLRE